MSSLRRTLRLAYLEKLAESVMECKRYDSRDVPAARALRGGYCRLFGLNKSKTRNMGGI
jgi:hypothetical protein